jgi:hypothetical protein
MIIDARWEKSPENGSQSTKSFASNAIRILHRRGEGSDIPRMRNTFNDMVAQSVGGTLLSMGIRGFGYGCGAGKVVGASDGDVKTARD